ncbi:hypothetical protein [Lactovum odontotermitis]
MVQQMVDSGGYEDVVAKVEEAAALVADVSNGLNTNDAHLKVSQIPKIFEIYDDLSKMIASLGGRVEHDIQEIRQLGVNIKTTDEEASS